MILDQNRLQILYFSRRLALKDLLDPLIIINRTFNFIARNPSIDHIAMTSYEVEGFIYEASVHLGMIHSKFSEKISQFKGIYWIEDLGPISTEDKNKLIIFENDNLGKDYGNVAAGLAGVDGWFGKILNKIFGDKAKKNKVFCSQAVAQALNLIKFDLSALDKGDLYEITPADFFLANLGNKKQFRC